MICNLYFPAWLDIKIIISNVQFNASTFGVATFSMTWGLFLNEQRTPLYERKWWQVGNHCQSTLGNVHSCEISP